MIYAINFKMQDMIEKGTLNLKSLKFRDLDEADEMLKSLGKLVIFTF